MSNVDVDAIRAARRDNIMSKGKSRLEKIVSTLGAPVPSLETLGNCNIEPHIEKYNHAPIGINTSVSESNSVISYSESTTSTEYQMILSEYSWIVILIHIIYCSIYYLYSEYLFHISFTVSFCTILIIERSSVISSMLFNNKSFDVIKSGLNIRALFRVLIYHLVFYVFMHNMMPIS